MKGRMDPNYKLLQEFAGIKTELDIVKNENKQLKGEKGQCAFKGGELCAGCQVEILKEQLTAAQEKLRWIPVGERLPREGKPMLILTSYGKAATAWLQDASTPEHGWIDWMRPKHSYGSVTHWRPIDLPEKDEVGQ